MKVVSYLAGIPSPHKNPQKREILTNFISGVQKNKDTGINHQGHNLLDCDVGVIQGWVHPNSPHSPHLNLRRKVSQNINNKNTIIVDSNLFNYDVGKSHHTNYHRYSVNGIFPTTGSYFTHEIDSSRWIQISRDLNISVKDWRIKGDHIIICCQRNNGWSMKGLDLIHWIKGTINELKRFTDRPIIIRAHPGDKNSWRFLQTQGWNLSKNLKIKDDFNNAWAAITYNSSPGVAAAIEGIPVFVTDPNSKDSQAFEVANIDLSKIENPDIFNRQSWLEKISMSHWNFDDLRNGTAWSHMRKFFI